MKKISLLLAVFLLGFTAIAQEVSVNTEDSELKWKGKKVTGEHWGYIALKDGSLTIKNGKITAGTFDIDMNSMTCEDLESPEWNAKLIGHLKSDDFFSTEKFPVATLVITESAPFKDKMSKVNGKLTIKGITHPVNFEAKKSAEGYKARVTVDRTKYDIKYGSGKFFDNLGDNMIDDEFILDVNIILE